MPVYKGADMKPTPDVIRPHIMMNQYGGEIKLRPGGGLPMRKGMRRRPMSIPRTNSGSTCSKGGWRQFWADELDIIGPGDLVYIPRGVPHGIRLLGPECRFFACKSPAGSGALSEDYTAIPNLDDMIRKLDEGRCVGKG